MSGVVLLLMFAGLVTALAVRSRRARAATHLEALLSQEQKRSFLPPDTARPPYTLIGVGAAVLSVTLALAITASSLKSQCFIVVAGGYLAALSVYGVKKWRTIRREREALFSLPLTLESLILLVEAGVGLLPAIRLTGESLKNPVTALLCRLHQITDAGVPFSDALREVATQCDHSIQKHVLLHLHVASSEGGSLASALRNLSDYAHLEWKLAVERRVRKLENTVVFPVFVGVLGLLLLSSAAPIVPLLELRDNLGSNNFQSSGWHARRTDAAPLTGEKQ